MSDRGGTVEVVREIDILVKCKYCGVLDHKANMYQDKFTLEYYHDSCNLRIQESRKYKLSKGVY